jgi:hypothetical protein
VRVSKKINKICGICNNEFVVYPSGMSRKFCSVGCANKSQTTTPVIKTNCARCSVEFSAKLDHGRQPKYCSKECANDGIKPEIKKCPQCDSEFLAHRTGHGLAVYCSMKCRNTHYMKGETKVCINCNNEFHVTPSKKKQRGKEDFCCSVECQTEYYQGEKHHMWEGGRFLDQSSNAIRVYAILPGYKTKYTAEHRIVVAKVIGRILRRGETVIHLNNINDDNRPENLFVCATNSEMRKRFNGSIEWPKESNLGVYK